MTLRSGEMFAGAGALGMAVDSVFGTRLTWVAEINPAASTVLAASHPDVPNLGDVSFVDWSTIIRPYVVSAGFPCQDVPIAGRRAGLKTGTRSGLWSECVRAIDVLRPEWVVIENVRGLLSAEASGSDMGSCPWCMGDHAGQPALRALGAVLGDLAELGYDAEWASLRASDVGAPHGRSRVFILAWPRELTVTDDNRDGLAGIGRETRVVERDIDGRDREAAATGPVTLLRTPAAAGAGGGPRDRERPGAQMRLSDQIREEVDDGTISLLPTPMVSDGTGGPKNLDGADFAPQLREITQLLPSPVAKPSGNTPQEHLRKKPGRRQVTDLAIIAENGLIETGGRLLPTPVVNDMGDGKTIQSWDEWTATMRAKHGNGNGHGPSLAIEAQRAALLPTPTVGNATGGNATRGGDRADEQLLPGIAASIGEQLLPTPGAYDGKKGGSQPPEERRAGGHSVGIKDVIEQGLLPTPRTSDKNGAGVHGEGGPDLRTVVSLLPTPRATRGGSSTELSYKTGGERSDVERPQGVVTPGVQWGPYSAAIHRWEQVLGRRAPSPVRFDGKNDGARLNPEFTEWMMGWPAGLVTDPALHLSRAEQLTICGNGVVPQQASAALRWLLSRPGVPRLRAS